jgi:hypothetical protein
MDMTHLPQDFKEFLSLLRSHEVKYLLIGGYAVGYHGYPRATIDLDVWVQVSPDNAIRIVDTLKEFGFNVPNLSKDLFLESDRVIRMGVPPMRLEIVTGISGVTFDDCHSHCVKDTIDGVPVNIISLQDLRKNKAASNRPKDINDLDNLPKE